MTPSPPKVSAQKGQMAGASGYSPGDVAALFEVVDEVLPCCSNDWEQVSSFYNEKYAQRFIRPSQSGKALKDKFCALTKGDISGGGKRQGEEQKAKEIQRRINEKHGVVVNNFSGQINESDLSAESEKVGLFVEGKRLSSASASESETKKRVNEVTTRRVLQGELLQAIQKSSHQAQTQHEDKMLVLNEFLEIMKRREMREIERERERKRRRRSSDSD